MKEISEKSPSFEKESDKQLFVRDTPAWQRNVGWIITFPFIVLFFLTLTAFHVIHLIAGLFGKSAHHRTLNGMNRAILGNMKWIGGAHFDIQNHVELPEGRPVLLVSNHQSMYDIPMIMLLFPKREIGFVAKKELGKWIPSISLSLRRLGSVLIDRKDPKQAIAAIEEFGRNKNESADVACIFPEGTRARGGFMKPFRRAGFETMLRVMPDALVVPIAIDGNWEFLRYNLLPVPFRVSITCKVCAPIEPKMSAATEIMDQVERQIRAEITKWRSISS